MCILFSRHRAANAAHKKGAAGLTQLRPLKHPHPTLGRFESSEIAAGRHPIGGGAGFNALVGGNIVKLDIRRISTKHKNQGRPGTSNGQGKMFLRTSVEHQKAVQAIGDSTEAFRMMGVGILRSLQGCIPKACWQTLTQADRLRLPPEMC